MSAEHKGHNIEQRTFPSGEKYYWCVTCNKPV